MRGDGDAHRDVIITGYHEAVERCVRDETWSYAQRPEGEQDELYHLLEDPKERNNLIHQHPDEAHRLARAFGSYFGLRSPWVAGRIEPNGIQGKYELASGCVDM